MKAVWQEFIAWFVKHLVTSLIGIASPLPLLPLYILVVGGCYCLHVCSHLGSFYLPVVFSFLYVNGFHYYYCYHYFILFHFDRLHWMSFSVTGVYVSVMSYFILFISSLEQGLVTGLWMLLAMGSFHPAGVGLLANCRVVWTPDVHLQWMLSSLKYRSFSVIRRTVFSRKICPRMAS